MKVNMNLVAFPRENSNKGEQRYEIGSYTAQKLIFFINLFVPNAYFLPPENTKKP